MSTPNEPSDPADVGSPRFGPPTTANPLWRVVVVSGAAFCLSCLLWITASFANQAAPGNQWLNRHGLKLIIVTGSGAIVSAWAAMAVDRSQTQQANDAVASNADDTDADSVESPS